MTASSKGCLQISFTNRLSYFKVVFQLSSQQGPQVLWVVNTVETCLVIIEFDPLPIRRWVGERHWRSQTDATLKHHFGHVY